MNFNTRLEKAPASASVPCRIDLGGTLDIATFHLPLNRFSPACFNMALDLRTTVTLAPWTTGRVKISSRGFEAAEFDRGCAPYDHPMGLMFSIADYFNAHGVHVMIDSASPPRSAMGGSSSAAVAMVAAFSQALGEPLMPGPAAWLAHYLEAGVAGVPCGVQDQMAAAFGGVNLWLWKMGEKGPDCDRRALDKATLDKIGLDRKILVSYCGIPHESKDINSRWVRAFIKGENRKQFAGIAGMVSAFFRALETGRIDEAVTLMNQETRIRLEMTPDVLDRTGMQLYEAAARTGCGARFTGAGGGGCVWALGPGQCIDRLRPLWQEVLNCIPDATILDTRIDDKGLISTY